MFFNSFFRYFLYLTGTKFILAPPEPEPDDDFMVPEVVQEPTEDDEKNDLGW